MDNLLAGNLIVPLSGRFACRVVIQGHSPFGLWISSRNHADHESGIGQSVIGFQSESLIAFSSEGNQQDHSWMLVSRNARRR
jgi:hypothetical protein